MYKYTAALALILAMPACASPPSAPAGTTGVSGGPSPVCDAAAELLASLRMPLSVDLFATPGAAPIEAATAQVSRLFLRYQAASKGNLYFRVVPLPELEQVKARELGLVLASGGGAGDGGYYFGLVFHEGSEQVVMPFLNPGNALDLVVLSLMREVRDKAERVTHRFGVLVGHGELSPSAPELFGGSGRRTDPNVAPLISRGFPSYRFVDVDLKGGAAPVDESLTGLLVTQPASDLTDAELRAIDRFVTKGRALAVIASSANVGKGDPKMRVTLGAHGLERLLAGYGVELRRDLVADPAAAFSFLTVNSTGTFVGVALPQLLREATTSSSPLLVGVEHLALPFASSLVLHRERQPHATFSVLARSSASARSEVTDGFELGFAAAAGATAAAGSRSIWPRW